jgi:cobalt-zinc-cadmium efflux system membrane fusion protein
LPRFRSDPASLLADGRSVSIIRPAVSGGLDVPAASVAWIGEGNAVFVRNETGFNVVPVKLRGKTTSAATIEGDLTPGQMVAASGLSLLENLIPRD